MAVNFDRTFGSNSNDSNQGSSNTGSKSNQPKAKLWLNVGYIAPGAGENGEDRFVSLPVGIPVDTTEKLSVRGNNQNYVDFQVARNDLLDQIMKVAEGLEPGADTMLNLQIQLRRTSEERAPATMTEGNAFAMPNGLSLVG